MGEHELSEGMVRTLRGASVTYPEVGRTAGVLPDGYHHVTRQRVVGRGRADFDEAARRLMAWQVQRGAGVTARTSGPTVGPDSVAVLHLGVGLLGVDAPVKVVRVVDEPRRRGFAYGTLPGHPESGEESFVVELGADELVTFTITAFSRPVTRLARLGGPVARLVQSWVTGRYLASLER